MVPPASFQIAPCPPDVSERLAAALGLSRITADTLVRRGLGDPAAARGFLGLHGPQHDPLLLGDAEEACDLLVAAIEAGTSVVVHGDYDADGVCATAILTGILRDLGAVVRPFLPSRFDEGYGLAVETVESLHAEGCGLLVTVDCGITAVEAVLRADELGLDVIVTDHHRPAATLPACPLVVPRGHGAYPFPDLCGAGVAWKLGQALVERLGADPALLDRRLDLVALATVADLVPLVGENRGLVRAGLAELRRGTRPGLEALMRVAGVDRTRAGSTQIGFALAPRLNAAGRMGHPDAALELLTTDDPARARELAERLDLLNRERQAVEREILDDALAMAEALPEPRRSARGLVLHSAAWHPGVIGIVASRLVERLRRPVVLVALEGDEGRGSGRSVPAFDLHAALGACGEHLQAYGGHRAAAGVTVRADALEAFAEAFAEHADATLSDDDLHRPERVDAVASVADVSLDLADELHVLEPFGLGNPAVTLLLPAVELAGLTTLGADRRHLRFAVRSAAGSCRTVQWGAGPALAELAAGGRYDVACRVERNDFNGSSAVQLVARAVAPVPPVRRAAAALCAGRCDGACPDAPEDVAADRPARPPWVSLAVPGRPRIVDRRGGSAVAELVRLAAAGLPLLVVCAGVDRRLPLVLSVLDPDRFGLGGPLVFTGECGSAAVAERLRRAATRPHLALADHAALLAEPRLGAAFGRVAVLDPPACGREDAVLGALPADVLHLVAGRAEEEAAAARRARRAPRALCTLAWRLLGGGPGTVPDLRARLAPGPAPEEGDLAWALDVLVDAGLARRDAGRFSRLAPAPAGVRLDDVPRYAARVLEHDGPAVAAAPAVPVPAYAAG